MDIDNVEKMIKHIIDALVAIQVFVVLLKLLNVIKCSWLVTLIPLLFLVGSYMLSSIGMVIITFLENKDK